MRGLKLRDARRKDREAVFEFCRNTWPGYGDYIQLVWEKWMAEKGGRFILAELNGEPVGIAKVSEFSRGEVWLQGLRVAPSLRKRGIANEINLEVLRTVSRMRPRAVRFCTASRNWASRRIGEKFGFNLAARFRFFWVKSRRGRVRGRVAGAGDFDAIYEFMKNSRFLKVSRGLIAEGWVFREFSARLVRSYIRSGSVMIIDGKSGIRGLAVYTVDHEEDSEVGSLGFVDGDAASIKALARNTFYMSAARGFKYCSAAVPTTYYMRLLRWSVYAKSETVGQVIYEMSGEALRGVLPARRRKAKS
jgi:RimJ/RimL family protein N-acetyltransferase